MNYICNMENLEIERKYLVKGLPNRPCDKELYMAQYYGEGFRVRRIMDNTEFDPNGKVAYVLSNKTKIEDGVYEEYEEDLTPEEFEEYISRAESYLVKIRRVYNREDGLKWELDEYTEAIEHEGKLYVMEIELPSIDHEFDVEEEFNDIIIEEVTGKEEFSNKSLSLNIK